MKNKPLILVTNDDGITSPGIKALVEVASSFGEVVVVAPDSPQSGQGHAITIMEPIRLKETSIFEGIIAYECSGTPVDCVKLAKNVILRDRKIDLCASGVNHGSNASINIIYSGTMSAAMEASIEGIPSVGFSLADYSYKADMGPSAYFVRIIIEKMLDLPDPDSILLNVNIPGLPLDRIRGMRVCRQGEGTWVERFQENQDPRGQSYYWLAGDFSMSNGTNVEDTDLWALNNNYVSIVPSKHDLTDHKVLSRIDHFSVDLGQ